MRIWWLTPLFLFAVTDLDRSGEARAQEQLSREDTAAILFSNRFSFTESGEPVLPVNIMAEQEKIEFAVERGLLLHPSGPGGPALRFPGRSRWVARLAGSRPAELGYRVALATVPTSDFAGVKEELSRHKEAGRTTTLLELGTVFSFQGTIFDSRETLVCEEQFHSTREAAEQRLAGLVPELGGGGSVHELLTRRPEGTVVLKEQTTGVEVEALNAIWFEPLDHSWVEVKEVETAPGFRWNKREDRRYDGAFYIAVDKRGKLAVVNLLAAEELLRGLVPAEIYPDSPAAALQAQAISARNELFSKIGHRHLADPYLLCSEQHCQVYKGLNARRKSTDEAVKATRGMVMFDENGRLADIRYHSTCGGHTEDSGEAWPGVLSPNLKGRPEGPAANQLGPITEENIAAFLADPPDCYCRRSARSKGTFRWQEEIGRARMDELVGGSHQVGRVEQLKVTGRGRSGRANRLEISGSEGRATVTGELTIRRLLGGLKSSLMTVALEGERWIIRGGGFGHGVGMCQLGAAEMARDGSSARAILEFYYRNVTFGVIY